LHQRGQWEVKDEYYHLQRELSHLPKLAIFPSPKEIVDNVLTDIKELDEQHVLSIENFDHDPAPNSQID
jgi:hypothetical protein